MEMYVPKYEMILAKYFNFIKKSLVKMFPNLDNTCLLQECRREDELAKCLEI